MRKVKIKIKFITPLMSTGADKGQKEFRVTELKALLRSTFRELYCFEDLEDMKMREAYLFGSTRNKAPVSIVLHEIMCKGDTRINMLPHKLKKPIYTSCYGIDSEVTIYFIERNKKNNVDFLEFYVNLLIQASIIGGIGGRSRKGYGSFVVMNIDNSSNNDFKAILPKNSDDILDIGSMSILWTKI